jgi:DNA-binding SARP family transcriptional activator
MAKTETLPKLELICFGAPLVRVDGAEPPADVLWRKHHALLIYLALSPGRERSRDHLMGTLWPDKAQDKARHSLNEAVRRLRTGLGARRLLSYGDMIGLSGESLELDVELFLQAVEESPESAVEYLRGDFLEGFSVDDAAAFETWMATERTRLHSLATSCLLVRGERDLTASRFGDALAAAKQALRLNAFLEPAANLAMRALALAGDATGALAIYHDFVRLIDEEIGEAPGKELDSLSQRIRDGRWQGISAARVQDEPPLVGRASICTEAFALVEGALGGQASVLVIVSDPGMGKTRILNDCAKRASLSGTIVSMARPLVSDHDARWSSLGLVVGGGLDSAPGLAGADPNALETLAAIAPSLAERFEPGKPRDTAHVASALEAVLRAVADEQPVAVVLDDAHLADGASIEALGAVMRRLREIPVVLLMAADSAGHRGSAEFARLRASVGRDLSGTTIHLKPLTIGDTGELVQHLAPWCTSAEDADRLTRRLHYESGGSPFLAVTLLHGLEKAPTLKDDLLGWPQPKATFDSPLPFSIPDLARLAIMARISDLDENSLKVLHAASIAGIALDLDLIEPLAGISGGELEEALDSLERHRFLVFDGSRYSFAAPLFAQVIRGECLTHGQRQRLRKLAIKQLSGSDGLESSVLRVELMAKALPGDAAFSEAVAVVKSAIETGAGRTARRALFAAERAARGLDESAATVLDALRSLLPG